MFLKLSMLTPMSDHLIQSEYALGKSLEMRLYTNEYDLHLKLEHLQHFDKLRCLFFFFFFFSLDTERAALLRFSLDIWALETGYSATKMDRFESESFNDVRPRLRLYNLYLH